MTTDPTDTDDEGLAYECALCGAMYHGETAAEACCGIRSVLAPAPIAHE